MLDIVVTALVLVKLTLVRLVALLNMPSIRVTKPVVGRVTLSRLVAPLNIFLIFVTLLVSQALRSWLKEVLFLNRSDISFNELSVTLHVDTSPDVQASIWVRVILGKKPTRPDCGL